MSLSLLVGAGLAAVLAASAAQAQVADAVIFKNLGHIQEGPNGSLVVDNGAFFNALLGSDNAGDFSSVTLTYPGGSQSIPQTGPTDFGIGPGFPDQASMDAAYPFGTYSFSATGGSAPDQTVDLSYTQDAYALNVPALSAASFDALQGLKTGQGSLALTFNPQSANPLATTPLTFFTIFGTGQSCALAASATSCTIDPHALAKGQTYVWELDFSDRIESFPNGVLTGTDFDVRTDGVFTTAVPEPATWATMLIGLGALGGAMRSRRRMASA